MIFFLKSLVWNFNFCYHCAHGADINKLDKEGEIQREVYPVPRVF
jgi:hypothetical protein